ncbi:hypothetical protein BGX38DRAFT_1272937 [Terfezia claveryi]|nr:hypothetical protein BGX38DRAFT_1272937 [Terfezia claveryi]
MIPKTSARIPNLKMPQLTTKRKHVGLQHKYASQLAQRQRKYTEVPELEELVDTEEEWESLDQELVMEQDAFAKLKASVMEDSVLTTKYY